ncbi:MAG: dienelactone hydrolase family protein [Pseudorhodoplanes sp.]|uniref:dienelactone hydrolase family protein n=1 Tax=Pseudorhodoplanes sp. TaxID=1934341 RepID=UPI003D147FE2
MRVDHNPRLPLRLRALRSLTAVAIALFGLALLAPAALAQAAAEEFAVERVFFRATLENRSVRLEGLIVKRSDLAGRKLPVALITHGKSSHLTDMLESKASDYIGPARDLARRGWLAVVVMRRGFGQSDGPMAAAVSCSTTSFADRFAADADDLEGALTAVTRRPDADPSRAIAIGVSAGGAAVVALAARNPKNLRGVISISGGLRMPDCPKEDVLVNAFRDFGLVSRIPNLWIYARNDSFFGPELVERLQTVFLDGGGDIKLVMYPKFGKDGHSLFNAAAGKLQWLMEMDAFLRFHGLPAARRDHIADLMKLLRLESRQRGFLDRYLAAPTYKVMAQTADGKHHFTQFGAGSLDVARKAALKACEDRYKSADPCRIVMENDAWLGGGAAGGDRP